MFGGFAAAALGTGGLVMAVGAHQPAHAESSSGAPSAPMGETMTEKMLRMVGFGKWVDWVVEPAERAGCPKGKLLPDAPPLPPGVVQRTLVLGLEECLIHTDWERKRGHRTMKRPGLEAFLAHMSQFYEIIIFTPAMASYAQPIANTLQDTAYVQHALFRENCLFTGGKYVKDLSYLNRDLKNVIIIDTNPDSYALQPHNAIHINEWTGDPDDTQLLELVPFLEAVFKEDIPDVRDVLGTWPADSIPQQFRDLKHQVVQRKNKGASLVGRGRIQPGVMPVLSTMVKPAAPHLTLPTGAPAGHQKEGNKEHKEEHQEAPKNPKKALFAKAHELGH